MGVGMARAGETRLFNKVYGRRGGRPGGTKQRLMKEMAINLAKCYLEEKLR